VLCVCDTALNWTVAATVSSSNRTATVAMRGSIKRLWCCLMTRRAARAVSPSDDVLAPLCHSVSTAGVDACAARGCVSTLRQGCQTSVALLFCVCVPRGIHPLFAVAALLLVLLCAERLFERAWCRCRRVVTCATVAVSLTCVVG
jgi:hypothetical protein